MQTFIIRRLIIAVIVILIVSMIIFLVVHLLPGNPVLMLITHDQLKESSDAQIAQLMHEYGLDRPLLVQYFSWLGNLFHGDMGKSITQQQPVLELIAQRLPITLHLALLSMVVSIIIGVPAGVICAIRRGRWMDNIITVLANVGITMPIFWLGIMLIYFIGYKLNWLPLFGYTSPFDDFWQSTRQVILPVFCLSIPPIAAFTRLTRSTMLEVMTQDYIRTAWSKGLTEMVLITRHALKNALIPVVTLIGINFSFVVGGSVVIETVFNISGMGRLMVNAALSHDYPVIQGVVLIISIIIIMSNLLIDVSYGWLDPRIKYE